MNEPRHIRWIAMNSSITIAARSSRVSNWSRLSATFSPVECGIMPVTELKERHNGERCER